MTIVLRDRARPDNLTNQVRPAGKSVGRRLYLAILAASAAGLAHVAVGPMLFLDASGIVTRDAQVVATDYPGVVVAMHVAAGDAVRPGQVVAEMRSQDMIDRIADHSAKLGQLLTRERQVETRLAALSEIAPITRERRARAVEMSEHINELVTRGLSTVGRAAEAARDAYEAERDLRQMEGERTGLADELEQVRISRREASRLLDLARRGYAEGKVLATVAGVVAPTIVQPGAALARGASLIQIYHGEAQVRAFLPAQRFYAVRPGDWVMVSDGTSRRSGFVERLETVSERLPDELQSQMRVAERQQIARVRLKGADNPFPSPSSVRIAGHASPAGLFARVAALLSHDEVAPEPASSMVRAPQAVVDPLATGSLPRPPGQAADWELLLDPADLRAWRPLELSERVARLDAKPSRPVFVKD